MHTFRPLIFCLFALVVLITISCDTKSNNKMDHAYTNELINETSPYLLQHAHNPVNWQPWSDDALKQAKEENKLLIVSIGYSSCHWCHVMEHESFEDTAVANVMNSNYVSIKVDREERPDVDNVYMNAVQLMTGGGGWPLNVIILPDGRPVWGGTYFPKDNWIDALQQISSLYKDNPDKLYDYASKLEQGLQQMDVIDLKEGKPSFDKSIAAKSVEKWSQSFDTVQGGLNRAPKFMMPNNYAFLMRYAHQEDNDALASYVHRTLEQMAFGGVYDQIGGGFARYSTDTKWHIPHFEKMLYDNGQLLSLYSDAYLLKKDPLYKDVVYQTVDFVKREMLDASGGFYSALDADSKNKTDSLEEGAYYVFTKEELKNEIKDDLDLFSAYYNVNNYGYWEKNNYVLIRQDSDEDFVAEHNLDSSDFAKKKKEWQEKLLSFREKRPAPRLDDKILTGWNGLLANGLVDAYRVFNEDDFLDLALKNANFIRDNQIRPDGGLNRNYKGGKSTINGYLEDYASTIQAFINLFEVTADKKWLISAKNLTEYTINRFYNPKNGMFYFTSDEDSALVSRSIEYLDNVIPASNSIMAKNLYKLSHLTFNASYSEKAAQMLHNVSADIESYPSSYSNWLDLMLDYTHPFYEIVITGKDAEAKRDQLYANFIPNAVIVATTKEQDDLDIFEGRWDDDHTWIYVCVNNACKLPVKTVPEALKLLEN